jgi:hypothetical protein
MIKLCKNKSIPVPLECINLDPNQLKKVISFLMDNSDITLNNDFMENLSQDNRSYYFKKFKDEEVMELKEGLITHSQASNSMVIVDDGIKTSKTCESVLDDYAIY